MKWTSKKVSLIWIPIIGSSILLIASVFALIGRLAFSLNWFGVFATVVIFGSLVGLFIIANVAAKYPSSWLATVATVFAALAIFILAGVALVFIAQGFAHLSGRNQGVVFIVAFYAGCFVLCEVVEREQRIKHFKNGELAAADWARRFRKITENTDPDVLSLLHRDGIALRNEFGNLTHPDFKKNMELLARLIQHDTPTDE